MTTEQTATLVPLAEKYFQAYGKAQQYRDGAVGSNRGYEANVTRCANRLFRLADTLNIQLTAKEWHQLSAATGRI